MIITQAEPTDLERLVRFRTDAARWLASIGSDQWSTSFPAEHILLSIQAGEVFVIREPGASAVAATLTLDRAADPLLWTPTERAEGALYVHKLTIDRQHAGKGIGSRLLDWAGDRAHRQGAPWLRLDAWTSNARLQNYYSGLGFKHVRTVDDPEAGGSGWVAQRPSAPATGHGLTYVGDFPK